MIETPPHSKTPELEQRLASMRKQRDQLRSGALLLLLINVAGLIAYVLYQSPLKSWISQ
jgi:hypothetical protein